MVWDSKRGLESTPKEGINLEGVWRMTAGDQASEHTIRPQLACGHPHRTSRTVVLTHNNVI